MPNLKSRFCRMLGTTLFIFTFQAHAQTTSFGDWDVGVTDEGKPYAAVANANNDLLIKTCNVATNTCVWYQTLSIRCAGDAASPALLNSPQGSAMHMVYCDGSYQSNKKTFYRYGIENPEQFDSIVSGSKGILGIAISLESGQFNVSRFSLQGGRQALDALQTLFKELSKRNNKQQPANQRL